MKSTVIVLFWVVQVGLVNIYICKRYQILNLIFIRQLIAIY